MKLESGDKVAVGGALTKQWLHLLQKDMRVVEFTHDLVLQGVYFSGKRFVWHSEVLREGKGLRFSAVPARRANLTVRLGLMFLGEYVCQHLADYFVLQEITAFPASISRQKMARRKKAKAISY